MFGCQGRCNTFFLVAKRGGTMELKAPFATSLCSFLRAWLLPFDTIARAKKANALACMINAAAGVKAVRG